MTGIQISRGARRRIDISTSLPTDPPADFEGLFAAVEALPDTADLCAEERCAALAASQRLINQLTAYQHQLARDAEAHGDAQVLHAGTTGTLIACATNQDPAAGSAMVNRAAALRDMPHVAAAFRDGSISVRHVGVVLAEHRKVDRFADCEASLVVIASHTEPGELRRVMAQMTDRSGLDDDFEKLRNKRGLHLSQLPNGNFRIDGMLDHTTGEMLANALASRMDRKTPGDHRSAPQRRADAFTEIIAAAQGNTRPHGVSGVSVLVDLDDLDHGQLADGTLLGKHLTELLTCDPIFTLLLGTRQGATFVPLAMARDRRLATTAQRQALIARDRGCIRCGKHHRYCHAHHIIGWASGGSTDLDNLALLCARCHHDLHHGHYHITITNGTPHIHTINRAPPARTR